MDESPAIRLIQTRRLEHTTRTAYIGIINRWVLFVDPGTFEGKSAEVGNVSVVRRRKGAGGLHPFKIPPEDTGDSKNEDRQSVPVIGPEAEAEYRKELDFRYICTEGLKSYTPGICAWLWGWMHFFLQWLMKSEKIRRIRRQEFRALDMFVGEEIEEGDYELRLGVGPGCLIKIKKPKRFYFFLPWVSFRRFSVFVITVALFGYYFNPLDPLYVIIFNYCLDFVNNYLLLCKFLFILSLFVTVSGLMFQILFLAESDDLLSCLDDVLVICITIILIWFGSFIAVFYFTPTPENWVFCFESIQKHLIWRYLPIP